MTRRMLFASEISESIDATVAAEEVCQRIHERLSGSRCDMACVFASISYPVRWPELIDVIHQRLKPGLLIGCSGSGIIGPGKECEWVPALGIVAASLPDVRLFPFVVDPDELELSCPGGFWVDKIGPSPAMEPVFLLFADPHTCDPVRLVQALNSTYPQRPIIGGLVSGGHAAGQNFLFINRQVHRTGAVGLAMTGDVVMDAVVSQGCRPVGRPYVVTSAEENVVVQLGGRQAVAVLHEVLCSLSVEDRQLAQEGSIFSGLAVNEMRHVFATGDFLIRHIVGIDPDAGAIALADHVQIGQTLQFHIRDAATSRNELRRRLTQAIARPGQAAPCGALLFSCTGRGKAFYGVAHQDVKTIQTIGGKELPIGGFFCNGEIGPIGCTNFLHGYTACLGLFRPRGCSSRSKSERSFCKTPDVTGDT